MNKYAAKASHLRRTLHCSDQQQQKAEGEGGRHSRNIVFDFIFQIGKGRVRHQ